MMRAQRRAWTAAIGIAMAMSASQAHHSTAEYDHDTVVEFEGELVRVYWGNPHPLYTLRTVSAQGDERLVELEGSAVYVLERVGVREAMIRVGERVRVAGYPSARRPDWVQVSNMLLEDGYEVLERGAQRRWTQSVDASSAGTGEDGRAAGGAGGLFRVWSRAALGDGLDFGALPLTTEAAARRAQWDPVQDNPAFQCIPHGMPAIMPNPFPIEFVNHGDTITLNLSNTVIRTIHMTENASPDGVAPTKQGYSVGRWDGRQLEIRTDRVDWPYFDDNGTPQSERVEMSESFVLSEAGDRLDYQITVTDPATFTRPVVARVTYAALGEPLHAYHYCPDAE